MLIAVGNEKGGCGKTTLAINLAVECAAAGKDTLLVDADPGQQSAARWTNLRRATHPDAAPITCVSMAGRMESDLKSVSHRYEMIIVDTGGGADELRETVGAADVLVVPAQPEPLDLWTLPTVEAIATRARVHNEALRIVLALNRIPYQSAKAVPGQVTAFLEENVPKLAPAATVTIIGRAVFGRAIAQGLGVSELRSYRDFHAESDIQKLYQATMGAVE